MMRHSNGFPLVTITGDRRFLYRVGSKMGSGSFGDVYAATAIPRNKDGEVTKEEEKRGVGIVFSAGTRETMSGIKSLDFVVAGRYRLVRKIGSGSFGDIYLGINVSNGEEVAVKLEPVRARHPQLLYESKLYKVLQGGVGIPHVRH
ncbi:hypothetical protein GE061_006476 [Apolygus lucorum]|uniref:Protein kinase domain-containing protein n=1 Tax=Apolygus lucorum TaxID=248454 RepID=A0A8S9WXX4_APOLU|nr:hypothetical protein GE061_006476 [Apolygus lucorum]